MTGGPKLTVIAGPTASGKSALALKLAERLGGALAIVGGHSVRRRAADGAWAEIASSDAALSCCVAIGGRSPRPLSAPGAQYRPGFIA